MDLNLADPKGLIRESYRIEGITLSECRSIFMDWALSLAPGLEPFDAMRTVLATYGADAEHPMSKVLTEGLTHPPGGAGRRGGRAARFGA
ncbi:hypothetical protein LZA78_13900 [Sinirhodobacter sp. WL0062]|uniref:Uncharacterized protein n=1 Tax=Rhodobacter flavimaris TaxID=2907145 RepID=A0ABS8YXP2_9RHOB|nr:hypothetical protein [Sinirhodobacter sp. WL0062]MCE5974577.1 hypothetical protein [Sinirhodobacter sp. WL0062]